MIVDSNLVNVNIIGVTPTPPSPPEPNVIPMQNTGVPLNSMPIAIILILIGLAGAFRVKKP
jgi:hypothetical protein